VLLAQALRERGATTVAMEDPCIDHYRVATQRSGLAVMPLPVDGSGASLGPLADRDDVAAAVLTPAHQYPMGVTLAPDRRTAFVDWAREHDAYVIEDDYDGEFRYDRQPVGALQTLDPERVVYGGTASKSLAPGLRLAWLALPASLVEIVMETKRLTDRHASVLDQLALADLLESGAFDRHVRRMRVRYRRRRDLLMAGLASRHPALPVRGIAAGLHLVIELPRGAGAEADVVDRLADRSVAVQALGRYWHGRRLQRGIVVGYGTPPEHGYRAAVNALLDGIPGR
jgi:GntR family transcriptional regulator/MocR family aminotransferase